MYLRVIGYIEISFSGAPRSLKLPKRLEVMREFRETNKPTLWCAFVERYSPCVAHVLQCSHLMAQGFWVVAVWPQLQTGQSPNWRLLIKDKRRPEPLLTLHWTLSTGVHQWDRWDTVPLLGLIFWSTKIFSSPFVSIRPACHAEDMSTIHTFSTTQPQWRDEVSEGNKLKRTRVTYIFSHDPKGPEELTLGLKRMFYLSLVRFLKENESLSDRVKFQFCHLNHVLS